MSIRFAKVFLQTASFRLHYAKVYDIVEPTKGVALLENLSTVLKKRRKELGLTLLQIAEEMNVSEATVQRWESGNIKMLRHERIAKLAQILKVPPASLMGWETNDLPDNIIPLPQMREWPVLGATACGKPLHREVLDETVLAPDDIKADVVFRCVGDSMINARIFDGDAVFIRRQPEVENGQIAVVRVGDEYTLKRVHVHEDYVELRAENPMYDATILRGDDLLDDNFEVMGLAVAFLSSLI